MMPGYAAVLFDCIKQRSLEKLTSSLEAGADVEAVNPAGCRPLCDDAPFAPSV